MNSRKKFNIRKDRRARRVRKRIIGTPKCPRLSVFRSNKHTSVQLIDDTKNITIAMASSVLDKKNKKMNKTEKAKEVGKIIAEKAKEVGIKKAVFDRGAYKYHGRIKALAESVRENGLKI